METTAICATQEVLREQAEPGRVAGRAGLGEHGAGSTADAGFVCHHVAQIMANP